MGGGSIDNNRGVKIPVNFISYMGVDFELYFSNKYKVIMELDHDFNNQKYKRKKSCENHFRTNFSEHRNCLSSTITCTCIGNKQYKHFSNHEFTLRVPEKTNHHSKDV